jgi:hypothetical protein
VLTAIRQNQRLAAVPVIVTSSSQSPRDQAETARLGIVVLRPKTFRFRGVHADRDYLKGSTYPELTLDPAA